MYIFDYVILDASDRFFFYFHQPFLLMGRRAKNKQSAPEPLHPRVYPTPKKLGKRKAEHEADADLKTHPRPTKKLKDSSSQKVNTQSGHKEKVTNALKNDDHAASPGGSSDGWEDVEDDYLASHTK
jgi:ribosomal RNA methyltransferase Nop2